MSVTAQSARAHRFNPSCLPTNPEEEGIRPESGAETEGNPPESDESRRGRARWIIERLREEYGPRVGRPAANPTDCLIGTILSQHTADRNSSAAFAALKQRYPRAADVERATEVELSETIRSAGLARAKARHIQASLRAVHRRFGTMDLSFLKTKPLKEAREILLGLPGVGPKTAACVLLFSCGHPALPVDTHVHRLARRLGLISLRDTPERAHDELEAIVPAADVYDFHVNLIRHGRQVCIARDPRCGTCILQSRCAYYLGERERF